MDLRQDRVFKKCGKCGKEYPASGMIMISRNFCSEKRNLIKVCEDCYNEFLNFLGIEDAEME